jgi:DNA-binding IclR family transcriptional regulator
MKGKTVQGKSNMVEDHLSGKDKQGIAVISKAAAVLRALGRNPNGLSLNGIAEETSLPRSTVQRIIDALEVEQFVEPLESGNGTRLGPSLGQLMRSAHSDVVTVVRPYLENLSQAVHETVVLGSAIGYQAIVVDRIIVEQPLCVIVPVGTTAPPYTTAVGKALLSQLPDASVEKFLENRMQPMTPRSVRSVPQLISQLHEIRRNGIAYDEEEHIEGICTIAVPLMTLMGIGPYAVAIAAPQPRYQSKLVLLEKEIMKCRDGIETALQSIWRAT